MHLADGQPSAVPGMASVGYQQFRDNGTSTLQGFVVDMRAVHNGELLQLNSARARICPHTISTAVEFFSKKVVCLAELIFYHLHALPCHLFFIRNNLQHADLLPPFRPATTQPGTCNISVQERGVVHAVYIA